jgi:hypothetical protein
MSIFRSSESMQDLQNRLGGVTIVNDNPPKPIPFEDSLAAIDQKYWFLTPEECEELDRQEAEDKT